MIGELRRYAREQQTAKTALNPPVVSVGGDGGRLVVLSSEEKGIEIGKTYNLGENTRLGRGPGNHISFSGHFASQEHARIVFRQGQYWLEDLGSLNHTYLNETLVERPIVLANGDRIRIGDVIFRFARWAYEMESDDGYRAG